jgi:hypothetical protein
VCQDTPTCNGSGVCNPNYLTSECRPAVDPICDLAEFCDGTSPTCPANQFAPAGTECGTSGGDCQDIPTCNGSGVCNPNYKAASTVCRTPTAECELDATCSGDAAACPDNPIDETCGGGGGGGDTGGGDTGGGATGGGATGGGDLGSGVTVVCRNDEELRDGTCVCKHQCCANNDCRDDKECRDGECVCKHQCCHNDDCKNDRECRGGACVCKYECCSNDDCRDGFVCRGGNCKDRNCDEADETCLSFAGNGGVSGANADGGAVTIGDVEDGSNAGSGVIVDDVEEPGSGG